MEPDNFANPLPSSIDAPYVVETIGAEDKRFQEVIAMWGIERKTLGLFPVGAFEARAQAGHLLVASTPAGSVLGYLTYRAQRRLNCAVIIHLCVARDVRGRSVSDSLWGALKRESIRLGWDSVRLKCRRDYHHTHKLWKRLGFVARTDVDGRSRAGSELTLWVHALRPENLLQFSGGEDDDRLKAVIDANVFYDLRGNKGNRDEESTVLLEPWLEESVMLCVVDELHNEIDRREEREDRDYFHREAQQFKELNGFSEEYDKAYGIAVELLGEPGKSESKRSDRKQLAKAATGKADVFITRDTQILDAAADIERRLGLRVMTPGELSSKLDEAERAHVYQPARLSGTTLIQRVIRADDLDLVVSVFQASQAGETKSELTRAMRANLAQIRGVCPPEMLVVWQDENSPLAFFVRTVDRQNNRVLVDFLRVAPGGMERTLLRHILLSLVRENSDGGLAELRICDPYLVPAANEALRELHFESDTDGWRRLTPAIVGDRGQLCRLLSDREGDAANRDDEIAKVELPAPVMEERYWPAKVLGEGVDTYIISIKATWAAQLFDKHLAEEELFGAFARLALNREQVYYRSARAAGLSAPARILWYVCKDDGTDGAMAIRACSRLLSFETGTAKELFRRYQRIGIYQWREILAAADNKPFADIMAIRFADTESFTQPVPVAVVRSLGIKSQFQSPTKITEAQFAAIYKFGMNRSQP
ncbi:MAG: GNAT family N-acetyltransferase [Opitutus sp.]|nr:GNAT family N-acetyltransferase [Opitutus sp.]MCS6278411.1 GNAT family N-acetyltransferase [Opitutus sp.]MCS6299517.1 GNAT family N-acetyltransferase [Opitutus sp.]